MTTEQENWPEAFQRALSRWEVVLPPDGIEFFRVYMDELALWNNRLNLTALKEPLHVALGHFADSLAPLCIEDVFKAKAAKAIDIGTGAGFPGLPLKIVLPQWNMTLIESVGKKCTFLKSVIAALELSHVDVLNSRCEELGHDKDHREKYDFVFARALSGLSTLIEYAAPFLKIGGLLVAHRGRTAASEASRVNVALEELGCEVSEITHYEIPGLGGNRSLVCIRKVKPISKHFPRRVGVPAKNPL